MITIELDTSAFERAAQELEAAAARILGTDGDILVGWRFGGPAAPYALAVHEIPPPPQTSEGGRSARHAVGGWKYMERPLMDAAAGLPFVLAALVRGGETVEGAVRIMAEQLMAKMKSETPVEFGSLRASGRVVYEAEGASGVGRAA